MTIYCIHHIQIQLNFCLIQWFLSRSFNKTTKQMYLWPSDGIQLLFILIRTILFIYRNALWMSNRILIVSLKRFDMHDVAIRNFLSIKLLNLEPSFWHSLDVDLTSIRFFWWQLMTRLDTLIREELPYCYQTNTEHATRFEFIPISHQLITQNTNVFAHNDDMKIKIMYSNIYTQFTVGK